MQREALYNLHRKVYFSCVRFVSKQTKFCAINFRNLKNWSHTILLFNKTYLEMLLSMKIESCRMC